MCVSIRNLDNTLCFVSCCIMLKAVFLAVACLLFGDELPQTSLYLLFVWFGDLLELLFLLVLLRFFIICCLSQVGSSLVFVVMRFTCMGSLQVKASSKTFTTESDMF